MSQARLDDISQYEPRKPGRLPPAGVAARLKWETKEAKAQQNCEEYLRGLNRRIYQWSQQHPECYQRHLEWRRQHPDET